MSPKIHLLLLFCLAVAMTGFATETTQKTTSSDSGLLPIRSHHEIDMTDEKSHLDVIYVPGWLRCHKTQGETFDTLVQIFPGARYTLFDWDGNNPSFHTSCTNADNAAKELAEQLAARSPAERAKTILIGHSLGGRITVRVLAALARDGLKIRRGVLFGAAIDYDDPDVMQMTGGSELPVMNLCNHADTLLKYAYGASTGAALGSSGVPEPLENCEEHAIPRQFIPTVEFDLKIMELSDTIKQIANHHAKFYAEFFRRLIAGEKIPWSEPILVPQEGVNLSMKPVNAGLFWEDVDSYKGWILQRNRTLGNGRILNPDGKRVCWGMDFEKIQRAFRKVRWQLK